MSLGKVLALLFSGLTVLGLALAVMLRGKNVAILNAKGLIADEQRSLMFFATAVILSIAVPTVLLLYYIAWKYRETNDHSKYKPDGDNGKFFNAFIWGLPTVFVVVLAMALIPATQQLEPKKAIASDAKPLTINVTAMSWKWLFVYPEQQIATVNYVQIPKDVPVVFNLTADEAPMSSFWIPNLGGQLYAMTGHVNQLNLIANESGDYPGKSAMINGAGFAGMKFIARVSDKQEFESWVGDVQRSPNKLTAAEYEELLKPSEDNPSAYYSSSDNSLFTKAIAKYAKSPFKEKHGKEGSE